MNTQEFIQQVKECRSNKWQNSDIAREIELALEIIADHFESCKECANGFDTQDYKPETLIDLVSKQDFSNITNWICLEQETIRMKLIADDRDEFDFNIEEEELYNYDVIVEINYIDKKIDYVILEKGEFLKDLAAEGRDNSQSYNFDDFNKAVTYLQELAKEREEESKQLAYEFYNYMIDYDFVETSLKIIKNDSSLLDSAIAFYKEHYEYSPVDSSVFESLQFYFFAEIEQFAGHYDYKERVTKLIDELAKEEVPAIDSWQQAQSFVARETLKLPFQAIADLLEKDVSTIQRNYARAKKKIP